MDIFENLENLAVSEECFNDIMDMVEAMINEVSTKAWADAAQKRMDDNRYMDITSRGKEELGRLKEIAKLPRDNKPANKTKKEAAKEEAEAGVKAIKADLRGDKEEADKQSEIAWKKGLVATGNKGYCLDKWKAR